MRAQLNVRNQPKIQRAFDSLRCGRTEFVSVPKLASVELVRRIRVTLHRIPHHPQCLPHLKEPLTKNSLTQSRYTSIVF